MTMEQLASYFIDNEDSTSVKIKSFHQSTKNIYPDVSFCVKGSISEHMSNINQFNESRLPNNISSEDLANMLNGEEANDLQKNAAMRQLIHHLSSNNSLSFDDILNEDAKNVIKYYWMTSTSLMNDWDSNFLGSEGNKNFDKTMESNLLRCWTRKFNYTLGQLIKEEGIVISKETITKFPRLVVSLHQKNQWISRLFCQICACAAIRVLLRKVWSQILSRQLCSEQHLETMEGTVLYKMLTVQAIIYCDWGPFNPICPGLFERI